MHRPEGAAAPAEDTGRGGDATELAAREERANGGADGGDAGRASRASSIDEDVHVAEQSPEISPREDAPAPEYDLRELAGRSCRCSDVLVIPYVQDEKCPRSTSKHMLRTRHGATKCVCICVCLHPITTPDAYMPSAVRGRNNQGRTGGRSGIFFFLLHLPSAVLPSFFYR